MAVSSLGVYQEFQDNSLTPRRLCLARAEL